jgi:tRNA-uridine 2-sulfurtransferase
LKPSRKRSLLPKKIATKPKNSSHSGILNAQPYSDMKKVCIAMSGGVDSSVAAFVLKQKGYDCSGVFMVTKDDCQNDICDVKRVGDLLGIKVEILELREKFKEILDYFCSEYKRARTPNPCVYCNRVIKFGVLWNYARSIGCDYIATGHYVRSKDGKIYTGNDLKKEQSYVLSLIDRDVIKHTIFPTGEYTKQQIRQIAADNNLGVENKPDSQEICFIPNDDYVGCIERLCPEISKEGNIVYTDGRLLGTHQGIHRYTIGQRRGLKVAMGEPVYVVGLDADTNTVTLGAKDMLYSRVCFVNELNWLIDKIAEPFEAIVKIRYNNAGTPAIVEPQGKGVVITFKSPVSAITAGQLAAVYLADDNRQRYLAGGGWLDTQPPKTEF